MQNLPSHIKIQKSALSAVLVSNVYFLFTLLEDNMSWENGYPITGRDEGYLCESLSVGWPRRCDSAATTPGSANARNRKDRPKNGGFLVFEMLEQGIGPCISVAGQLNFMFSALRCVEQTIWFLSFDLAIYSCCNNNFNFHWILQFYILNMHFQYACNVIILRTPAKWQKLDVNMPTLYKFVNGSSGVLRGPY